MWFEDLVGFKEGGRENVHNKLEIVGNTLISKVNGLNYNLGSLEIASLRQLREKIRPSESLNDKLKVSQVVGDVKMLHANVENSNAVFQAASQFNLLEMVQPYVTPENGIARYENDLTQGPACAIACGAGTIYRNYFVPLNGQLGQTSNNQINCLDEIGNALNNSKRNLWKMENGYALPSLDGLKYVNTLLNSIDEMEYDALKSKLKVGIQWDTEVTISDSKHDVSQVYCSALPVSYSHLDSELFKPFACLVLEATYEATILAAIYNMQRTGNKNLFLTLVGGGAFGNKSSWIFDAIKKSVYKYFNYSLEIKIVSYGQPREDIDEFCDLVNQNL